MLVKDIMSHNVITVTPETTLKEVGKILKEKRVSGLPVVDQHKQVVGIITLTDMMHILDQIYCWKKMEVKEPHLKFSEMFEKQKTDSKVKDFMTANVVTLDEHKKVEDVMELMFMRNIHSIPVVRDGELVGIIGKRDLICSCF